MEEEKEEEEHKEGGEPDENSREEDEDDEEDNEDPFVDNLIAQLDDLRNKVKNILTERQKSLYVDFSAI